MNLIDKINTFKFCIVLCKCALCLAAPLQVFRSCLAPDLSAAPAFALRTHTRHTHTHSRRPLKQRGGSVFYLRYEYVLLRYKNHAKIKRKIMFIYVSERSVVGSAALFVPLPPQYSALLCDGYFT